MILIALSICACSQEDVGNRSGRQRIRRRGYDWRESVIKQRAELGQKILSERNERETLGSRVTTIDPSGRRPAVASYRRISPPKFPRAGGGEATGSLLVELDGCQTWLGFYVYLSLLCCIRRRRRRRRRGVLCVCVSFEWEADDYRNRPCPMFHGLRPLLLPLMPLIKRITNDKSAGSKAPSSSSFLLHSVKKTFVGGDPMRFFLFGNFKRNKKLSRNWPFFFLLMPIPCKNAFPNYSACVHNDNTVSNGVVQQFILGKSCARRFSYIPLSLFPSSLSV